MLLQCAREPEERQIDFSKPEAHGHLNGAACTATHVAVSFGSDTGVVVGPAPPNTLWSAHQSFSFSEPNRAKHCVAQSCSPRQFPRHVMPLRHAGLEKHAVVCSLHLRHRQAAQSGSLRSSSAGGHSAPGVPRTTQARRVPPAPPPPPRPPLPPLPTPFPLPPFLSLSLVEEAAGLRLHLAALCRKLLEALYCLHLSSTELAAARESE